MPGKNSDAQEPVSQVLSASMDEKALQFSQAAKLQKKMAGKEQGADYVVGGKT